MNKFETASMLLTLCPIPTSIQDIIFGMLLSQGTPSAAAIKRDEKEEEKEIPIKVVALGTLDRCRHTLYYMEKTINHNYDNASYFSKEALFELHIVYLNGKRSTPYTTRKIQELTNHLKKLHSSFISHII
jgi:hypothetical protein